jgi:predicted Zn-dependent protease
MIWCAGYLTHKKTIASLDLLDSNPAERERMEEALAREMGQESRAEKD